MKKTFFVAFFVAFFGFLVVSSFTLTQAQSGPKCDCNGRPTRPGVGICPRGYKTEPGVTCSPVEEGQGSQSRPAQRQPGHEGQGTPTSGSGAKMSGPPLVWIGGLYGHEQTRYEQKLVKKVGREVAFTTNESVKAWRIQFGTVTEATGVEFTLDQRTGRIILIRGENAIRRRVWDLPGEIIGVIVEQAGRNGNFDGQNRLRLESVEVRSAEVGMEDYSKRGVVLAIKEVPTISPGWFEFSVIGIGPDTEKICAVKKPFGLGKGFVPSQDLMAEYATTLFELHAWLRGEGDVKSPEYPQTCQPPKEIEQ